MFILFKNQIYKVDTAATDTTTADEPLRTFTCNRCEQPFTVRGFVIYGKEHRNFCCGCKNKYYCENCRPLTHSCYTCGCQEEYT